MQETDFVAATWRKSSYSGCENANCVEVAAADDAIGVRDSKDPHGGTLVFTRVDWRTFINSIKAL